MEPDSMDCSEPFQSERINQFSLVSYLPGKLGEFVTKLRQDLVHGCVAHSHVTVLPPRPLQIDPLDAEDELRVRVAEYSPFMVEIPRIRIFEETSVVFADIGDGRDMLLEMHDDLNAGRFAQDEQHTYHPHITLAQGLTPDTVIEAYQYAVRKWAEAPTHRFLVDTLIFVQNTAANRWVDLAECELRGAVPVRSPLVRS